MNIRRRAMTFVELIVSAVILSILMVAMTSAMLVAAKAAPRKASVTDATFRATRATDLMEADIACATGFTILGSGSIELTVPDRTGDGLDDTVRYAWSGTSGDPLYRTFNSGTAVEVATDVRACTLTYVKTSTKQPTSYSETGETLLLGVDSALINSTYSVTGGKGGVANSFLPSYPTGAAYVRVTRADFLLKSNTLNSATVQAVLRSSTSLTSMPTTSVDGSSITAPTLLAGWVEATFSQNTPITAGNYLQLLLLNSGGGNDFVASYRSAVAASTDMAYSTDGTNWSYNAAYNLPMYVYGVYGIKNPDSYIYNLTHVCCTLKCGNSSSSQIQSDFRALNAPQVTGP